MNESENSSIYGPVKSWRLGWSLGVDVLCVDSICSFDCVYCQLGAINQITSKRDVFVSAEKILNDLKLSDWQKADVITFSGSGEPTLAENLGEVIAKIKEFTKKPIIVLTNSTMLHLPEVRRELALADRIFCKLDAWSPDVFRRVDRPAESVTFETVIDGIKLLRIEFAGFLAIQTMILRQPSDKDLENFAEIINSIKPDEIQLNLPTRPVPTSYLLENRGNSADPNQECTKLKTISGEMLEEIGGKLSELVSFPIITTSNANRKPA